MNINYVNCQKDICYLYHVQSCFGTLMADLDFKDEFSLSYWSELKVFARQDEEFVKIGCMIFILLMALDKIEGSGDSLSSVYKDCYEAVEEVVPFVENETKLKSLVLSVLETSNFRDALSEEDEKSLGWAYTEFVEGYFQNSVLN